MFSLNPDRLNITKSRHFKAICIFNIVTLYIARYTEAALIPLLKGGGECLLGDSSSDPIVRPKKWILHTGKHDCNQIQRIRTTGLGVLYVNTVSYEIKDKN